MSLNDKISIKRKIQLSLDARNWELYSPDGTLAKSRARLMNNQLEIILNGADDKSRREVTIECHKVMGKYADGGAMDSEAMAVLEQILDRFFA